MGQVYPSPRPGRQIHGAAEVQKTATGNRIEIDIRGQIVGRCQSVDASKDFGTEPVHEIGTMMPAELVPLRFGGRLSVSKYMLNEAAFESLPMAYSEDILLRERFNLVIRDRQTGKTIKTYVGCLQASGGEQIAANRPVNQNATFLYMDEAEGDGFGFQVPA